MRRPRLPLLASFISLVIVALFVYTSPNLSSLQLDGIYRFRFAGGTSEGGDEQIFGAIDSVNAVPTTTPLEQTFDLQQTRPGKGAMILEDSTKGPKEIANSLNNQQKGPGYPVQYHAPDEIPNIFHFTHLQAETISLDIGFQQFISIYSAYYYCKPSRIYIHTNVDPKAFREARYSNNQWTRKIASMPVVLFKHEVAPSTSYSGVQITKLAHQSDFIRTRVMKKWGGVFMDEDSYLLKDLVGLRQAGYKNVVARQIDGKVGCGMFLSVPGSQLVTAYQTLQDDVFNGGWTTHSVDLLTRLTDEFSVLDKEVLVMDHTAFFPLSWKAGDLATIYEVNGPSDNSTTHNPSHFNLTSFIDTFEMKVQNTGRDIWKTSYALHGFNSEVKGSAEYFGEFGGITLEYVLVRNSNFARAIYPIIKHALTDSALADGVLADKGVADNETSDSSPSGEPTAEG